ncbi:MAG: hypothetical protein IEMM0008_1494 [bacterium]|nr:MAG: hypothetical protein IEMM0008_1494 [bacterium]
MHGRPSCKGNQNGRIDIRGIGRFEGTVSGDQVCMVQLDTYDNRCPDSQLCDLYSRGGRNVYRLSTTERDTCLLFGDHSVRSWSLIL